MDDWKTINLNWKTTDFFMDQKAGISRVVSVSFGWRGLFRMERVTWKLDPRWCWWQWDGHLWRAMGFVQFYRRVSRSEKKQSFGICRNWVKQNRDETLKMSSLLWNLWTLFCLSFDYDVYDVWFMKLFSWMILCWLVWFLRIWNTNLESRKYGT